MKQLEVSFGLESRSKGAKCSGRAGVGHAARVPKPEIPDGA